MNVGDLVIVKSSCAGVFIWHGGDDESIVDIDADIVHLFADDIAIILNIYAPSSHGDEVLHRGIRWHTWAGLIPAVKERNQEVGNLWFRIVSRNGIIGWIASSHVDLLQQYVD